VLNLTIKWIVLVNSVKNPKLLIAIYLGLYFFGAAEWLCDNWILACAFGLAAPIVFLFLSRKRSKPFHQALMGFLCVFGLLFYPIARLLAWLLFLPVGLTVLTSFGLSIFCAILLCISLKGGDTEWKNIIQNSIEKKKAEVTSAGHLRDIYYSRMLGALILIFLIPGLVLIYFVNRFLSSYGVPEPLRIIFDLMVYFGVMALWANILTKKKFGDK
jgi:hypothetical protein